MNGTVQSHGLIERLRENHSKNIGTLVAAGVSGPGRHERCPVCGLFEPVAFWTPGARHSGYLYLRCPSGCPTRIRFALGSEAAGWGGWVRGDAPGGDPMRPSLGATVLLLVVFYLTAGLLLTDRGRAFADRLASLAEADFSGGLVRSGSRSSDRWIPREWLASTAVAPKDSSKPRPAAGVLLTAGFGSLFQSEPAQVLVGEGDRREEVVALVEEVTASYGASARAAVRSVRYLPDSRETQVVIQPQVPAWKAYFADRLPRVLALGPEPAAEEGGAE
jgi:hypothetical protein